jgi:hypothetical protein
MRRIANNYREASAKFRSESSIDSEKDLDERIRELEELLDSNKPEDDSKENYDVLVKISSYESALSRCFSRVIKILLRIQNIRGASA